MKTIRQLNNEIEELIQEVRALNKVLFNVGFDFSHELINQRKKLWNKITFLKNLKKAYILKKD